MSLAAYLGLYSWMQIAYFAVLVFFGLAFWWFCSWSGGKSCFRLGDTDANHEKLDSQFFGRDVLVGNVVLCQNENTANDLCRLEKGLGFGQEDGKVQKEVACVQQDLRLEFRSCCCRVCNGDHSCSSLPGSLGGKFRFWAEKRRQRRVLFRDHLNNSFQACINI